LSYFSIVTDELSIGKKPFLPLRLFGVIVANVSAPIVIYHVDVGFENGLHTIFFDLVHSENNRFIAWSSITVPDNLGVRKIVHVLGDDDLNVLNARFSHRFKNRICTEVSVTGPSEHDVAGKFRTGMNSAKQQHWKTFDH
jgi:hypothetical protein